jgi:spore photoproduct lyase
MQIYFIHMITADRTRIEKATCKGEFWKPCPGTGGGYLCCGYQILTPLTGCGMYCRYCILQVYFEKRCQTVFENYSDLEREVREKMAGMTGVVRFGTGEFGDSLFTEETLGLSRKIAKTLEPYDNVVVEFKTKSANVSSLGSIKNPLRVVIGFSVSTPRMIALLEKGTASLDARLAAARQCEEMGFHVAFHFDPMIQYEQWDEEYRSVVRAIYSSVKDPANIAWVSMGGFRSVPALKKALRKDNTHLPLFAGEMIAGSDGKLRYFRPTRVAFYTAMLDEFERHDPGVTLYLCMESREVWEDSGMIRRIPEGLVRYLDARAETMLHTINNRK